MSTSAFAHAPVVRRLSTVTALQLQALAELQIDCVEGGASVSFMQPLSMPKALTFWGRVAADVATGARALLVAEDESGIVGTVQLVLEQPENDAKTLPWLVTVCGVSSRLVHRTFVPGWRWRGEGCPRHRGWLPCESRYACR